MKTVPKYIKNKVERMNRLMDELVTLNIEVEEWAEKLGVTDAYDLAYCNRDDRGYAILDVGAYVTDLEDAINSQNERGK